jgi:hypothetical protein
MENILCVSVGILTKRLSYGHIGQDGDKRHQNDSGTQFTAHLDEAQRLVSVLNKSG